MNRAAVVFRVAGSAAAAVALTITPEPHAAPAGPARAADAPECAYGEGSYVIKLNAWVRISGQDVDKPTQLAAGQRVQTGPSGRALVCLSPQRLSCRVRPTTAFLFGPRTGIVVQMYGVDGRMVCERQGIRWKLRRRGEALTSDGAVAVKPLPA